jgi:glycerol-3-phosphate O-acyltransferase
MKGGPPRGASVCHGRKNTKPFQIPPNTSAVLCPVWPAMHSQLLVHRVIRAAGTILCHIFFGVCLGQHPKQLEAVSVPRTLTLGLLFVQAVLAEYIQLLLQRGQSVEFFIEGGRGRDGKVREEAASRFSIRSMWWRLQCFKFNA